MTLNEESSKTKKIVAEKSKIAGYYEWDFEGPQTHPDPQSQEDKELAWALRMTDMAQRLGPARTPQRPP